MSAIRVCLYFGFSGNVAEMFFDVAADVVGREICVSQRYAPRNKTAVTTTQLNNLRKNIVLSDSFDSALSK
jgi:hypothetical protein